MVNYCRVGGRGGWKWHNKDTRYIDVENHVHNQNQTQLCQDFMEQEQCPPVCHPDLKS